MVEGIARAFPVLLRWTRNLGSRLAGGRLVVMILRWRVVLLSVVGAVLITSGLIALHAVINLNTFLAGTGINNTAAPL